MKALEKAKEFVKDITDKKITADMAYSMSRYGKLLTIDDLLNKFYKSVDNLIETKSGSRQLGIIDVPQYSLVMDIPYDLLSKADEIKSHYVDLGYYVKILDNNMLGDNLIGTYVFICWRR